MRAHVVELVSEDLEASLLRAQVRLGIFVNPVLKRAVHPFVSAILLGLAWLDPDRSDPQLDPPAREVCQSSQRARAAEGRPVVADQLARHATLAEHLLDAAVRSRLL